MRAYVLVRGYHDCPPDLAFFQEQWRAELRLAEILGLAQVKVNGLPYYAYLPDGSVSVMEISPGMAEPVSQ